VTTRRSRRGICPARSAVTVSRASSDANRADAHRAAECAETERLEVDVVALTLTDRAGRAVDVNASAPAGLRVVGVNMGIGA
jgi:hypothetical protein